MPEPCPDDLRMRAVEKPPERCEGAAGGRVERDRMGSTIFRHGIGRSEPDGHAPRAEACRMPGLDPRADQGLSGNHAGGAAGLAWRARRRGESRLDLALPESLRPRPQEAGAGGGRARPARPTATPSGLMSKPGLSRRPIAATSSSWTLRAAERPMRCAPRSGARAPVFSSFRPAAPIPIRSSRRSPSSSDS